MKYYSAIKNSALMTFVTIHKNLSYAERKKPHTKQYLMYVSSPRTGKTMAENNQNTN